MGRTVLRSRVRLDLNDADDARLGRVDAHEQGPEQATRSLGRVDCEEGAREGREGVLGRDAVRARAQWTSRTRSESGMSGPVLAMKTGMRVSTATRPMVEMAMSV